MKVEKRTGWGLLLIVLGALVLLHAFGIGLGGLISWIVPIALMVLGVMGWAQGGGRAFLGAILIIIGASMLLGQLGTLLVVGIGVALIVFGFNQWTRRSAAQ